MRFMWGVGCFLTGLDCVASAMGVRENIFGPDLAWLWWLMAAGWMFGSWTAFTAKLVDE